MRVNKFSKISDNPQPHHYAPATTHSHAMVRTETEDSELLGIGLRNGVQNKLHTSWNNLGSPESSEQDEDAEIEPKKSIGKIRKSYFRMFKRMIHGEMSNKQRNLFYFSIFFAFFCAALRLAMLIFISAIIDVLADSYNGHLDELCPTNLDCLSKETLIHFFVVILILICLMEAVIKYVQSMLVSISSSYFSLRLNATTFRHIISQNLSFFDKHNNMRHLLSRDMKHIRELVPNLSTLSGHTFHVLFGIIYLFIIKWNISLIIVANFVLFTISALCFIDTESKNATVRKNAFDAVLSRIDEMLKYMETIKIFSKEEDESFIFQKSIQNALKYDLKRNACLHLFEFGMNIIWYLSALGIIWYSSFLITHSDATLGILFIDLSIFLQTNFYVYHIIALSQGKILTGFNSMDNVIQILDISKHDKSEKGNVIPENDEIVGVIEIIDVTFSYPNNKETTVLNNISLKFEPSTTTALVGVSGSGKSTIFKMLMRLIDDDLMQGQILIDNIGINEYNLAFLHSRIGYVGQSIHLFENRTIAENIKFGMKLDRHQSRFDADYFDEEALYFWRQYKSITRNDVIEASKIANIHGFIMHLADGYDTMIGGKHGIKLSAGQMQRIAIARSVLMNPKILLLDEAMSNVDPISKHLIKESLDKIMIGRTVVVIAHRLKTVMNANCIYVINKGQVVETGKHDDLRQIKNGYYANFLSKQTFA